MSREFREDATIALPQPTATAQNLLQTREEFEQTASNQPSGCGASKRLKKALAQFSKNRVFQLCKAL